MRFYWRSQYGSHFLHFCFLRLCVILYMTGENQLDSCCNRLRGVLFFINMFLLSEGRRLELLRVFCLFFNYFNFFCVFRSSTLLFWGRMWHTIGVNNKYVQFLFFYQSYFKHLVFILSRCFFFFGCSTLLFCLLIWYIIYVKR